MSRPKNHKNPALDHGAQFLIGNSPPFSSMIFFRTLLRRMGNLHNDRPVPGAFFVPPTHRGPPPAGAGIISRTDAGTLRLEKKRARTWGNGASRRQFPSVLPLLYTLRLRVSARKRLPLPGGFSRSSPRIPRESTPPDPSGASPIRTTSHGRWLFGRLWPPSKHFSPDFARFRRVSSGFERDLPHSNRSEHVLRRFMPARLRGPGRFRRTQSIAR
jgi:hypothetical protein